MVRCVVIVDAGKQKMSTISVDPPERCEQESIIITGVKKLVADVRKTKMSPH